MLISHTFRAHFDRCFISLTRHGSSIRPTTSIYGNIGSAYGSRTSDYLMVWIRPRTRGMPNRPVLIIVDYSPLQELTHHSVPEQALYTAMHPNNLRNTTATEHEALFTYARILEPNEIPNVQIQHLRPLMVIRLRTQWGIDFLASDLEFRYADLTGDVFQVPNTTSILDLLNEYRPDWRFRQYNYIHSTTLVPGTTTPFILRLQCHKVSQGVILPWTANAQ